MASERSTGPRLLVAPQEFKGSLTAAEAARALAEGLARADPDAALELCPLADGGPGFLDTLSAVLGGERVRVHVCDPLRRRIPAHYLRLPNGAVVVEAAHANGIALLRDDERDPLRADTYGVGELIAHALGERPHRLVVGVGGSATNDGGAGMARALGAALRDAAGRPLPPGAAALAALDALEWRPPDALEGVEVLVAVDVWNPLLGPEGATAVYGPQKGVRPEEVPLLEDALTRWAAAIRVALGRDVSLLPGGGAAGGLAAGLVAFLDARVVGGFELVADAVRLPERFQEADAVVTGEGRIDRQTWQGKVVGRLVAMARALGRPVAVFAGAVEPGTTVPDSVEVVDLSLFEPDPRRRMARAHALLSRAAEQWLKSWAGRRP